MILSIDSVKRELGKQSTDSDWNDAELNAMLTMYVNYVEDDIDGLCMRKIGLHPYVEKQRANKQLYDERIIRPADMPIQNVTQIRFLNGQDESAKYLLADKVYSFDEERIEFYTLTGFGFFWQGFFGLLGIGPLYIEMTYTAGFTPYPPPLESLALKMVHWRYKQSMASKQGALGESSKSDATFSSISVSYTGLEKELEVCKNYIPMYA